MRPWVYRETLYGQFETSSQTGFSRQLCTLRYALRMKRELRQLIPTCCEK